MTPFTGLPATECIPLPEAPETRTKLIYGPKYITFPADSDEMEVIFESSEIHPFTTVMKVDKVQWNILQEGETKPKQSNVPKVLYCVTQSPIYPIEGQLLSPVAPVSR